MSHHIEVTPASSEPESIQFDPTMPGAAHEALIITNAVRAMSHEVPVPEEVLETVDHVRESAFVAHISKAAPASEAVRAATPRQEAAYEATGAATPPVRKPSPFPAAKDPEAAWKPTPLNVVTEARQPVVFDAAAARITAEALHRMARRKLTSFDPEVRAERKEALAVLGNVFGERHPVHEAASRVVSGALRVGQLAVMPAVLLTKISRKR